MHDFDVILKMDWLAKYYANLDYHKGTIDFRIPREHELSFIGSSAKMPLGIISTL